jgi:3-hydroxy acid dehydrogenase/malonic semialdehyde reductase
MIVITGASSGIGLACAQLLASQSKNLILLARRKDRLDQIMKELIEVHSCEIHVFELDVSDHSAVEALVKKEALLFSKVNGLINNAGLAKGRGLIQDGEISDWDAMINTNLKGLLYITRSLLPILIKNKNSHIVNIGSIAGRWPYQMGNIYCATKAAVHSLSEAMRLDLNGTSVRVTEISPGMVETEFSEVRFNDKKKAKDVYAGMTPLTAADIAETIAWSLNRPAHVCIQELVIYPTDQASPSLITRKSN